MKNLLVVLSILVIIGLVGYVAFDFVTDYMVRKTLSIMQEDPQLQSEIDSALESLNSSEPVGKEENTDPKETTEPEEETGKHNDDAPNATQKPANSPAPKETGTTLPTTPPTKAPDKKSDGLTLDDLNPEDKAYVMSIYKRFSAGEVAKVSGMLSGGITTEEKKAIKSIVYAKVSSAEVSALKKIASKYQ